MNVSIPHKSFFMPFVIHPSQPARLVQCVHFIYTSSKAKGDPLSFLSLQPHFLRSIQWTCPVGVGFKPIQFPSPNPVNCENCYISSCLAYLGLEQKVELSDQPETQSLQGPAVLPGLPVTCWPRFPPRAHTHSGINLISCGFKKEYESKYKHNHTDLLSGIID